MVFCSNCGKEVEGKEINCKKCKQKVQDSTFESYTKFAGIILTLIKAGLGAAAGIIITLLYLSG